MAQLTYDPTPADQPEFNEAEQEALAIGEAQAAAEQQMYAGKFKDAESLEAAYIELQKKLGEPKNDDAPEVRQEEAAEEVEETTEEEPYPLSDQEVAQLQTLAGGPEGYNEMLQWAGSNLSKEEIEMFDAVVSAGDRNACYYAISNLASRWKDAVGDEKPLLTGRQPTQAVDQFRSQAEVVEAMKDPRYDKDPAYRQDVFAKLERSNLQY